MSDGKTHIGAIQNSKTVNSCFSQTNLLLTETVIKISVLNDFL